MAKLIQSVEFFVVGGPVQPDRSCYVERRADQDLIDAIVEQRFAYVLAARGMGKTSLMLRTSRTLRSEQQLTAVVDLGQIGAHGEGADPSRWFYSVAHRILREIRLKYDLQSWWQERSAFTADQRFADFLWEVVLDNTKEPITILFDEVEHIRQLTFAMDFFAAIRNCYSLRVSEPEFARLNFVVFGAVPAGRLCPDPAVSPFLIGDSIELDDFTLDECYRLEPGFGLDSEAAYGLIDRIYGWTHGQPYLTQKLARAVTRRGGRLEDVERSVQDLFLAPNAALEEPQLSHMRALLSARGPATRPALQTLRRLTRGNGTVAGAPLQAQEKLMMAGVVRREENGALAIRNRIYAQVFTEKWARSAMPFNWRGVGVAAGVALLCVLAPYWYMNDLPRPYVQVLENAAAPYADADDAYARLHRLPGFAGRADELFTQVLARRSRESQTPDEVMGVDAMLRALPGREAFADGLLGEFWLRRTKLAVDAEERDAAIAYAAAAAEGQPELAAIEIAHLVGDDYTRLQSSVHLPFAPTRWAADWSRGALAVIEAGKRARTVSFAQSLPMGLPVSPSVPLTALLHVPLIRELSVDSEGSAGRFTLELVADHAQASDLTVTLAAPNGVAVTVPLSDELRTENGFTIGARALSALADEPRQGVWRFTIVDGQAGNAGVLHRWSLNFSGASETWLGAPVSGIAIPDPLRTEEVQIDVSRNGTLAVARPLAATASASLALWNLPFGQLIRDMRLDGLPDAVEISPDGTHILVQAADELTVWSVETGEPTARIRTQTEFLLPPALSAEGSYVAIAERVDGAKPLYSLLRIEDGALVASVDGSLDVSAWVLGPEARYLALLLPRRHIDIMNPRRGSIVAELELQRAPQRVLPITGEDALVTVEEGGSVRIWRFEATPSGLALRESWMAGTTSDARSLSVADSASALAYVARADNVVVHDLARQRAPLLLRTGRPGSDVRTQFSADGGTLLTGSGDLIRAWSLADWALAPADRLDVSALALGAEGRVAALGLADGYVRARSLAALDSEDATSVDYIGHRGRVSALALNVAQNLIASGGDDGVARIWNLATVSPTDALMRHPEGPVTALALSRGGEWLLSAAPGAARLWRLPEGELAAEYPINGRITSIAFAPDGERFAIGDSAGNVLVAAPGEAEPVAAWRADSAVTALAFAPGGHYVASGDDRGALRFWALDVLAPTLETYNFARAVRWLMFDSAPEGLQGLTVQTEQWLHRLQIAESGVAVEHSRLLPPDLEPGAAPLAGEADSWRLVGGMDVGRLMATDVDFASDAAGASPAQMSLLDLDWRLALGMTLDPAGNAVPVIR
jgi:WD40 repeat protein